MNPLILRATRDMKMGKKRPVWLDTVMNLFPPLQFAPPAYIQATKKNKLPRPPKIVYPEDAFRKKFFKENDSELWKPTVMNGEAAKQLDSPDRYNRIICLISA